MQFPALLPRVLPGDLIHNFPLISLVCVNSVTIILAIIQNWDLATVMFIYLAQSIIIGFFTVVSLLAADTDALETEMEKPIRGHHGTTKITHRSGLFFKGIIAGFFCLHYGLFHWGYYTFIVESGIFGTVNFGDPKIWLSCSLFFANHLYSYSIFRNKGPRGSGYINEQFFTPYRRIIPMHLTIIFGSIIILILEFAGIRSTMPVLVLFLFLKTYSDIRAHLIKHYQEENPYAPPRYF